MENKHKKYYTCPRCGKKRINPVQNQETLISRKLQVFDELVAEIGRLHNAYAYVYSENEYIAGDNTPEAETVPAITAIEGDVVPEEAAAEDVTPAIEPEETTAADADSPEVVQEEAAADDADLSEVVQDEVAAADADLPEVVQEEAAADADLSEVIREGKVIPKGNDTTADDITESATNTETVPNRHMLNVQPVPIPKSETTASERTIPFIDKLTGFSAVHEREPSEIERERKIIETKILESFSKAFESVGANFSQQKSPLDEGLFGRGLYHYKKWWERNEVLIYVNGDSLCGIPIFTDQNTLRVVNDKFSYFVPLEKIDYIRTNDGLC